MLTPVRDKLLREVLGGDGVIAVRLRGGEGAGRFMSTHPSDDKKRGKKRPSVCTETSDTAQVLCISYALHYIQDSVISARLTRSASYTEVRACPICIYGVQRLHTPGIEMRCLCVLLVVWCPAVVRKASSGVHLRTIHLSSATVVPGCYDSAPAFVVFFSENSRFQCSTRDEDTAKSLY